MLFTFSLIYCSHISFKIVKFLPYFIIFYMILQFITQTLCKTLFSSII